MSGPLTEKWEQYPDQKYSDQYSRCVWDDDGLVVQQALVSFYRPEWPPFKRWLMGWLIAIMTVWGGR